MELTPTPECPIDPSGSPPKYSVSQWSTPRNTVMQDIEQIARTGGSGIGLWEPKLTGYSDDAIRESLAEHGLSATFCVPRIFSVLATPASSPSEPRETAARVEQICNGMARLAAFDPVAILVAPGASGDPRSPAGPLQAVVDGLADIADTAAAMGLRVGFEFLAERRGGAVTSLAQAAEVVEGLRRDNINIVVDVWHAWPEHDLHERLRDHAHRIGALQVNDVRDPERSWCDRPLPGDGRGFAPSMIASLLEGGFTGWYDLEVMSDDGTWGRPCPTRSGRSPREDALSRPGRVRRLVQTRYGNGRRAAP